MKTTLLFVLAILFLVFGLEGLSRLRLMPSWIARKLLHMGVGGLVLLYARTGAWHTLTVVSLGFAFLNLVERMLRVTSVSKTQPESWGTVLFPVAVAWMALAHPGHPDFFYALAVMFFADPVAAFAGRVLPLRPLGPKSLGGSGAFFLVSLALGLPFFPLPRALLLAALATLVETVSDRGLDNLLLPPLLALWIHTLDTHPHGFWQGAMFALAVGLFAVGARALTLRGAVAAGILGLVLWSVGQWAFVLPVLVFFVLGSLATRLRGKKKAEIRTPAQVLANGWVAGLFALLYHVIPHPAFLAGYLAGICEAAADTLATETGGANPKDILTGAPVPRGTSGGVTRQGFLGGLAGSLLVALSGWGLRISGPVLLGAALLGFAGSVVDSLLGARLQGRWRCVRCGKEVEESTHCGHAAVHLRGVAWMDNNVVNALSGLFSGLGGLGLWLLWSF